MEEIKGKPTSERSAGFHDAKSQYLRDTAACHDDAPNGHRDNMKKALRAGQKHQRQTFLREDGSDLHGEVVGISDDYVKMLEQCSMPRSSSVQGLCMKCGKSGQLLICCGDSCARAFHESCLDSLARFDKDGHFYCLFCIYRNAFLIYKKAKRKALKARRNLFKLYNGGSEFYILKQTMPSAKVMINHNGNKQSDVPFNQQSTNSSNEEAHNGIMIEEENHTRLGDVHHKVSENQPNWLNGSTDLMSKDLLLCRESIECGAQVVLQDIPSNLLDKTDACHVLTREEEDQHPIEDHALPTDDILLNEILVCREPLQLGHRENVCADVDRERLSVQANESSILMVEEKSEYADVAKQGPLYASRDISSALMVQKENEHAYVTDQEPLHMLANISSLLLIEEENMHTDASILELPSQTNKISDLKMDDEHGHQPLNLQGETDTCHGLMGVAEDQQHVEGHSSTVNDRLPSEIYASRNRADDQEKSFETEVCCESLQVEHRQTVHAGVCDHKFPSLSANKSSTLVAEDGNLHADVADQERPSSVNKISDLKTDDECSHHLLNLLDETDFYSKPNTETKKQESVEGHPLIADDSLPSETYISCNRGDDGEYSFESEVSRENLQVLDVVDGQKFSSVLTNRSSTSIVEEENVHADVADQAPLSLKSKKSSTLEMEENVHDVHAAAAHQEPPSMQTNGISILVVREENAHTDVSDQERPSQPIKSSALQMDDECGHGTKRKALASQIKERFSKRNRRKEATHKSDFCRETVRNPQADSSSGSNFRRCIAQRPSSIPRGAPSRRAKCFWKPEEEKLLEEVMQKALNMDEGRISWKKILEDGRHIFHGSRTPADLKDKWRGILKKEAISKG
ncbi:hypothetical protein HPP92_005196 [Vanilla planifolia]|uniref:Myb-like domain-containing protein n=1 Tax=Vanilla planifolia TaxID=51239 RepID=A0A835VB16_VANPL|nr:hypothetical protein HPP92_005495 [Vanilla planifolia]KAG0494202.1 hypothetical protein HPP92_005196 [Vanilla planifolia]